MSYIHCTIIYKTLFVKCYHNYYSSIILLQNVSVQFIAAILFVLWENRNINKVFRLEWKNKQKTGSSQWKSGKVLLANCDDPYMGSQVQPDLDSHCGHTLHVRVHPNGLPGYLWVLHGHWYKILSTLFFCVWGGV